MDKTFRTVIGCREYTIRAYEQEPFLLIAQIRDYDTNEIIKKTVRLKYNASPNHRQLQKTQIKYNDNSMKFVTDLESMKMRKVHRICKHIEIMKGVC